MGCFTDIITVKDNCAGATSTSGLLSNDIGISLEDLNKINNSDYPTGELFFEAKRDFAIKQVVNDISAQLQGKYKIASVVEGSRIGFNNDNKKIISGYNGLSGLELELCNSNSYLDVYISSISLFTDFSGDIDVNVYDLIQGKIIDTITISCIAGEVSTLEINKTYKSDRKKLNLAFLYDSSAVNSYSTTVTKDFCFTCNKNYSTLNTFIRARGAALKGSPFIKSSIESQATTAGLSIVYSLQCNHNDWLCTIANLLAMPILYKYGMEVAEHALNSSNRVNTKVREQSNAWENKLLTYANKYELSLGSVLRNIKLPSDSKCFSCDSRSKHIISIP